MRPSPLLSRCILIANSIALSFALVSRSLAEERKEPKPPREPAAPVRDTNIEDIQILHSLMEADSPEPREEDELSRLAQFVLQKSPPVKTAFDAWQTATLTSGNTRASMYPSLTASSTIGQKGLDPNTRPGQSNNYGNVTASLTEILYDNGLTLNTLDNNLKNEERLRLQYEYTRDTQLLAAAQAYLNWSQAIQVVQIDEVKRKILRRQYQFINSQFRQGIGSRVDVLRLEASLRSLQLDTLHHETAVVANKAQLLDVLNVTPNEFDTLKLHGEETGAVDDPGEGTDQPLTLDAHRELKMLRLQEQVADVSVRIAERAYWPQLNLRADAGYINDEYMLPHVQFSQNYTANWDALFVLSWTFWDWGIQKRNVEIAKVNADSVRQASRQTELDLDVQLKTVVRSLQEFKDSLDTAQELVTLEQQTFNALENDYRNGRAGYLDLVTEINNYITARQQFMNAYFSLRAQKFTYTFHRGDIFGYLGAK